MRDHDRDDLKEKSPQPHSRSQTPFAPEHLLKGAPTSNEEAFYEDDGGRVSLDFPEYLGEVKARKPWLGFGLSLVSPGLGYAYVGQFAAGVLANSIFVLTWTSFVLMWSRFKFFPLLPLSVLFAGWGIFSLQSAFRIKKECEQDKRYLLQPTNNILVYISIYLFTFILPLLTTWGWAESRLWDQVLSGDEQMYPAILKGDLLLIDRTAFLRHPPRRGDLIMATSTKGSPFLGRVIGIAGDQIQIQGDWPHVKALPLTRYEGGPLETLQPASPLPSPKEDPSLVFHYELPHRTKHLKLEEGKDPSAWYVIASSPLPTNIGAETEIQRTRPSIVPKGSVFILNDNRSLLPQRSGGELENLSMGREVPIEDITGRPLFIVLSYGDEGWRWDRVGMELR